MFLLRLINIFQEPSTCWCCPKFRNSAKMMLKIESIKNRHLKRFIEHIFYFVLVTVLIPSIFYFELNVVAPAVVQPFEINTYPFWIHHLCALFLLFNILGNLIYGVFTDSSIRGKFLKSNSNPNWTLCAVCECMRPPRAWHCDLCNICVLKRDHHCPYMACCVGYYNHRYFIMFTMYVFIAMLYAFYYNVYFLAQFITWNHGLVLAKFMLPLVSLVVDFGNESLYILMVLVNIIIATLTGFLTCYHFYNILNGRTTPERKHCKKDFMYDRGWRMNLVEALGARWYFTWILPFIHSPLPGNGIDWNIDNKYK